MSEPVILIIVIVIILILIFWPYAYREATKKDFTVLSRGTTGYLPGVQGLEPYDPRSRPLFYRID